MDMNFWLPSGSLAGSLDGESAAADISAALGSGEFPSLAGTRILVVEDNVDTQVFVARMLEKAGGLVDLAANGLEGYRATFRNRYDVILMDVVMPECDGCQAAKLIRGAGYEGIIIALSAFPIGPAQEETLAAECDAYEPKPISRERLLNVIDKQVRLNAEAKTQDLPLQH